MSKHWRPDDISSWIGPLRPMRPRGWRGRSWRRVRSDGRLSGAVPVLLGAVLVGIVIGTTPALWPSGDLALGAPDEPIAWNEVQAPPKPKLSAEDEEWLARADDSAIAAAAPVGGSAGGRAGGVRLAFGYCHSGGGTNCVIDGDTFRIGGQKVRIAGIDAPETHPPRCAYEARLGAAATEKLHTLLNSGPVTMTGIGRDRDRYGRLLRNVQVGGRDVGQAMVRAGVAREYAGGRRSWC